MQLMKTKWVQSQQFAWYDIEIANVFLDNIVVSFSKITIIAVFLFDNITKKQ